MKNAGKARSYGLYRHLRTSKEIIENLLNYYTKKEKAVQPAGATLPLSDFIVIDSAAMHKSKIVQK